MRKKGMKGFIENEWQSKRKMKSDLKREKDTERKAAKRQEVRKEALIKRDLGRNN